MKKSIFILLLLLPFLTFSQVTTSPSLPTANDEVLITFDASGTGLDGYTGDVYAHTGVTVNGAKWQNVIESWGDNATQPKLTRDNTNSNLYTLIITPTVYSFYGVASTETISEFNFVFRSSDATQQTGNIFIPIYEAGLNISFTNPTNNSAFNLNENFTISAESSINADLELFIDGNSQLAVANTTTISLPYAFTSTGSHLVKVSANDGTTVKEQTITIFIKSPTQNANIPAGVKKGVNINTDNSVTFVLEAPNKNDVFLIGDFNNWELQETFQFTRDISNQDLFWITVPDLDPDVEYGYQYFVDFSVKVADPYSEKILDPWTDQYIKTGNYPNLKSYPDGLTTGYVSTFKINEPVYNWVVSDFAKPSQDNLIIYELLIRDFTESDSFTEAITHLDYLQSLGINAIELMPINEFEGADSWGYNPALYMALDKSYGTKNDFKAFVDACHERGIAVLADVVFNHSYGQSPLLQMYFDSALNKPAADNPWYNQQSNFSNPSAQWGYDFNHESPYTTSFFNDVLSYWLTEYKIDGFRFDFTKGFSNTPYGTSSWGSPKDASRIAILKNYADHVWNQNTTNKPYVIFEHLADNSEEKELANYGIMLWGNMNHSYTQNTKGYSSDSDLSWMSYQQRGWNNPNVVGYMESHDEERLMYNNLLGGNSNTTYNVKNLNTALARQETAGMFFFTIPGPKMIWQFGELGYNYSINTCEDGSVNNNCRLSRKPIHWDYFENSNRKQIYNTWATMIAFKKKYPEVFNTTDYTLNVGNTLVKSILLKSTTMDIVIIGNFNITEQTISTQFSKTGTWYEYFKGEEKNIINTTESITLKPGEYRMYSTVKLLDPRGGTATDDSDGDGIEDTIDLCPNTPIGINVTDTGCPIFSLPFDNFIVEAIGETCTDKNNGIIKITASETYDYIATLEGTDYVFTNNTFESPKLAPGSYSICVSIPSEAYEQCYMVTIEEGTSVSAKSSVTSNKLDIEIEQGTAPFNVFVNNKKVLQSNDYSFSVNVQEGDLVQVKTNVACEGIFSKSINSFNEVVAFPNPTNGLFEISLPTSEKKVTIELFNIHSQLISKKEYSIKNKKVNLSLRNNPDGIYIIKVNLDKPVVLKIIKQ